MVGILALGAMTLACTVAYYATRPASFDNKLERAAKAIEADNLKEFMQSLAAIEQVPGKADHAALLMGRWHAVHRRHLQALNEFSKCHSDEEVEMQATLEGAHVFLAMNNRWEAANILLKLIANGKDPADAHRMLAEIFQHWGANEKTIEHASLWAELKPDDPFPWLLLAEEASIHHDDQLLEKCIDDGLARKPSNDVAAKLIVLRAAAEIEAGELDAAGNDIAKLSKGPRHDLLLAQKQFAGGDFSAASVTLAQSGEAIKSLGRDAAAIAATLKMQIAAQGTDAQQTETLADELLGINKTSVAAWETLAKVAESRSETDRARQLQNKVDEARQWQQRYQAALGQAGIHTIDPAPRYELLRLALIADDEVAVKRWKDTLRELDPEGRMMPDELEPYLTGVIKRVRRYSPQEIRDAEWFGRPRGSLPQFVIKE